MKAEAEPLTFVTNERSERVITARPCIKCGKIALRFWWDKELMQDHVTCCYCHYSVRGPEQADRGATIDKVWNPANNPHTALVKAKEVLTAAQVEVRRLAKLARKADP